MKSILSIVSLFTVPALLVGCGSFQLGQNVSLSLDTETQTAKLEIVMGDGLEVNMNGSFPIEGGKGSIYFVPATKTTPAKIGFEANLAVIAGSQLAGIGTIATMPNGAPLPVAMTPPLLEVQVIKNANFNVAADFAITPELQLGATIGIAKMSTQYIPAGGLSLCQNFRNQDHLAFAAVCVYGPNGVKSGGIFIGANFGNVLGNVIQPNTNVASMSMALSQASEPRLVEQAVVFQSMHQSSSNWVESSTSWNNLSSRTQQKAANNVYSILKKR